MATKARARKTPARKTRKVAPRRPKWWAWLTYLFTVGRANALVLIICLFISTIAIQAWWGERQLRRVAEFGYKEQAPVTETTDAKITSSSWATKNDLDELTRAVRVLGGKLVGGVKLEVPEKSQEVKHDSLVTTTGEDSTRTAIFRDSTFAGTIEGKVTAPPVGPLGINYTLTRPAFNPEVGFMEKDGQTYTLVSWQGEQYKIKAAYAPKVNRPRKVVPFTTIGIDPEQSWVGQLGVETRSQVLGVGGWAAVQFESGEKARAIVGGKKEW